MVKIRIKRGAFSELIRSVWETDPRESMGYLFGNKIRSEEGLTYVVETIHPSQRAIRTPTKVKMPSLRELFRCMWYSPSTEDHLGDYHSHHGKTNGERKAILELSKRDIISWIDNPDEGDMISLLVSMNRTTGYRKPKITQKKIFGTTIFEEHYSRSKIHRVERVPVRVGVAGYYWEKTIHREGEKPIQAELEIDPSLLENIFSNNTAR